MVTVTLYNGREWTIDRVLKTNLDILINDVKNSKMDLVIVVDGPEGIGKSFLARGLAMYCATGLGIEFTVDDIQFDLAPYIGESLKAARDGRKHKINLLDEARKVLHRARGGSYSNVKFTNYLSECRALGQVHIILAPAFHDLDKYLVMWRMSILIHCKKNYVQNPESETGVSLFRGEYEVFVNGAGGKKALNTCWEMKSYTYPHQWETRGRWPSKEVFTPAQLEAYEKKKFKATVNKYYAEEEAKEKAAEEARKEEEELKRCATEYMKSSVFAKKYGLKAQAVIRAIKEERFKGTQIGRLWYVHRSTIDKIEKGQAGIDEEYKEMRRKCIKEAHKTAPYHNSQPDKKGEGQRREAQELQKADPLPTT